MNKEIPEEFYCPLTKRLFVEPVVLSDGITYEKNAIEKYAIKNFKSFVIDKDNNISFVFPSPSTNNTIRYKELPNKALSDYMTFYFQENEKPEETISFEEVEKFERLEIAKSGDLQYCIKINQDDDCKSIIEKMEIGKKYAVTPEDILGFFVNNVAAH